MSFNKVLIIIAQQQIQQRSPMKQTKDNSRFRSDGTTETRNELCKARALIMATLSWLFLSLQTTKRQQTHRISLVRLKH